MSLLAISISILPNPIQLVKISPPLPIWLVRLARLPSRLVDTYQKMTPFLVIVVNSKKLLVARR